MYSHNLVTSIIVGIPMKFIRYRGIPNLFVPVVTFSRTSVLQTEGGGSKAH